MSHPSFPTVGGPTEESGAHQAHRSGFAFSGEDARIPGVAAERRPLSRGAIRSWTIGSVVGSLLLASVVAVAFSRANASESKTANANANANANAKIADAVPAQPAATELATARPPVIPLEALPIAKDEPQPVASAAPKTRTRRAGTAVSSPARALRVKTVSGAAATTAKKTSAP